MARIKKHKPTKEVNFKRKEKKGPSKEIIITIIIASVMILSVFGIMFSSYNDSQQKEIYGEYEFLRMNEGWATDINGERAYFTYSPSQVEELNISEQTISLLESPVLIVTFNPDSESIDQIEAARLLLAQHLAIYLDKALIYGITEESDVYNLTQYTCLNSTQRVPVIELRAVDESGVPESGMGAVNTTQETGTRIYSEGSCVVVAARDRDWLAASERLLYGMLGII